MRGYFHKENFLIILLLKDAESQATVKKMFVGGLKEDISDDQLREFFEPHGKIANIDLITDKTTGKKRGFGFISFEDYDTVDKLVCEYSS